MSFSQLLIRRQKRNPSPEGGFQLGTSVLDPCLQLFQMLPDRVCLLSPNGTIQLCNPAFAESFQQTEDALTGQHYANLLPDAIAAPRIKVLQQVFLEETPKEFTDHLNGVWLEHRFFPFRGDDGSVSATALISRDITELILAKKSSDTSGQRLDFLLDQLPGMIYRCINEPGWPMVYASGGAFELTGFPATEFTMQNPFLYSECIHPDDRSLVWQKVQEGIRSGKIFSMEYRIRDAAQNEKWVWERGKRINGGGDGVCWLEGVILDVTDRKKLEHLRAEHEKNELRTRKAESLARMAGGVAHHFNNKLQTVIGYLQFVQIHARDSHPEKAELQGFANAAYDAAEQAASMSLNLLTCLGQRYFPQLSIDLSLFIPLFCAEFAGKFETEVSLPPGHMLIRGSTEDLREIFLQLLMNAKEASPDGKIRVTLSQVETDTTSMARIDVSDDGPGVPLDKREQIFEPFYTTKFPGRGLGLAMVSGITQQMGGSAEMLSNPPGGALMRIHLPLTSDLPL